MNTAITKQPTAIVMPAVTADEAVNAFNAYQELAKRITTPEDIQVIQNKEFKKKSFWRKCQRFFNLSVELINERKEINKDNSYTYFVMYRAVAPNGAHCDGDGACTSNEKGRVRSEHDTRATAHTRAKNRSIADLVAFGEVSAEEINGEHEDHMEIGNVVVTAKCADCGTSNQYHKKSCKLQPSIPVEQYDAMLAKQEECDHLNTSELVTKKEGKNKGRIFIKCNDCGAFRGFKDEIKETV